MNRRGDAETQNVVMGEGTHSARCGAAIFPDALRWLWRDYLAE